MVLLCWVHLEQIRNKIVKQIVYKKNNIPYVEIKAKGYDDRYNIIKKIVSLYLENGFTVDELQEVVNVEEKKLT